MIVILILFFASLVAITILLGRKVALIRSGAAVENLGQFHPLAPDFLKVKAWTKKGAKKYGYLATVAVLKVYVRTANFLQRAYQAVKTKIKEAIEKRIKRSRELNGKRHEVSGFLKMIGEYKHKIRNLKHKIREEEENR